MRTRDLPSLQEWRTNKYAVVGEHTTEGELHRFLGIFDCRDEHFVFVPENPSMAVVFTRLDVGEKSEVVMPGTTILHRDRHDVPGLEKGKAYRVTSVYPDASGGWDGRTWFVHYDSDTEQNVMIAYAAIGRPQEVGGDTYSHSRLDVVKQVVDLMVRGISPDAIWAAMGRIE